MVTSYTHTQYDTVKYVVSGLIIKTDGGGTQEFTCTITDYELTTDSSSVISPSGLSKEAGCSALACKNYDVDTSSITMVRFYTKVTFEGGGSIYTTNRVTIIINHVCHAAIFDSTMIASTTQYSKTEFSSELFTTKNPSGCPVTYEISTTIGVDINVPRGLNSLADVSDAKNFKIKPTDATVSGYAEHTFYVRATITDSTHAKRSEWTNQLTFYHGCGNWSSLDETSLVLSDKNTQKDVVQYIVSGLIVKINSGGSQEYNCTITDYELTTDSSSVVSPSPLSKKAGHRIYYIATNSTTAIQFYLKITYEGGSSKYTENQLSIPIYRTSLISSAIWNQSMIASK